MFVCRIDGNGLLGFHRTLCHVEARREMRAPISRERYGVPTYVRSTDREVDLSVVTPIKSSVSRGVEEIPFACLSVSVPAHVMKASVGRLNSHLASVGRSVNTWNLSTNS